MEITSVTTQHLVVMGDLNHHGTLYAARTAEWIIETAFLAAAVCLPPDKIVCVSLRDLDFQHSVKPGEIVQFIGKAVYCGKASLFVTVRSICNGREINNGFLTFVHVNENGKSIPHGLHLEAGSSEDMLLQEQVRKLLQM